MNIKNNMGSTLTKLNVVTYKVLFKEGVEQSREEVSREPIEILISDLDKKAKEIADYNQSQNELIYSDCIYQKYIEK